MKNGKFNMKGGQKYTLKKILSSVLAAAALFNMIGCKPKKNSVKELVWAVPGNRIEGFDAVEKKINEITEKKLKLRVKFDFLNSSDYQNRVNAKIESGEPIDLCFTGYLDSYMARVFDERLIPLNELLKYVPKLEESVPDYLWKGAEIGGRIYAVPHEQISATSTAMIISKQLADKYDFDVGKVKSAEDIGPFLKSLKENEPDVYPIKMNWGLNGIGSMDENEFYETVYAGVYIKYDNGKITVPIVTEDENRANAAKLVREWYNSGYIRRDVAVASDSATELQDGKYGVWFEAYKPGVERERKLLTGNDVYAVQITKPYMSSGSIQGAMTGIPVASPNAFEAIKLLELVNTEPEILNLLTFGIENKNYKKISANVVQRIGEQYSYQTWLFGNQFLVYTDSEQDGDVWEKTKEINESAVKSPLIGFAAETSGIATEITRCNEVVSKYSAMNNGSEEPADYWEQFDTELKAAGAEIIRQELEKQIDEFLNK